jgi:hypothetical protein
VKRTPTGTLRIIDALFERSQNLLNYFNSWLQSQSFNPIRNCLYKQDWGRGDEIRVILSTDCQEIRKLPWDLWICRFRCGVCAFNSPTVIAGQSIGQTFGTGQTRGQAAVCPHG